MEGSLTQTRCTIGLAENQPEEDGVWTFHGVVLRDNDVTNGANGPKYWPVSTLQAAEGSLTGRPVADGHNYNDSGHVPNDHVIGRVTKDVHEPGIGWLYEMRVGDDEIAKKLRNGFLEVSLHADGLAEGHNDEGQEVIAKVVPRDLAIVDKGGAQSNTVDAGSIEDSYPTVTALASGMLDTVLEERTAVTPDEDPDEEEEEGDSEESAEESDSDESESGESTQQEDEDENGNQDPNMSDDDTDKSTDGLNVSGYENPVILEESRHSELQGFESMAGDYEGKVEELETELEETQEVLGDMHAVLSDRLADLTGHSEDMYEETSTVTLWSEIQNFAEESEDDSADVVTGTSAGKPKTTDPESDVELGEGKLSDEEQAELQEMEATLEQCRAQGLEAAAEMYEEKIQTIKGE